MPKLKTHKGASKRFKKTGTGKVVRHHSFARHILTSKTRSRKRKLKHSVVADETDQAKLKRMIPCRLNATRTVVVERRRTCRYRQLNLTQE